MSATNFTLDGTSDVMSDGAPIRTPTDVPAGCVDCPPGFRPLFRSSPFLDATGPYFYRPLDQGFVVGLRVQARHANASGTAHGGLLATLADVSLGYVTAMSQHPPVPMTTTSLTLDYVGAARIGDWLEAYVSVVKVGRRLAFANVLITANGITNGAASNGTDNGANNGADNVTIASGRATFLVVEAVREKVAR